MAYCLQGDGGASQVRVTCTGIGCVCLPWRAHLSDGADGRKPDTAPASVAELPPQPGGCGSQPVRQDDGHLLRRLHHGPHPEGEWSLPHGSGRGGEAVLSRGHPCWTLRTKRRPPCFWFQPPALPTPAPLTPNGILGDSPCRASGSAKTHLCSGVRGLLRDSERP